MMSDGCLQSELITNYFVIQDACVLHMTIGSEAQVNTWVEQVLWKFFGLHKLSSRPYG